MLLAEKTNAILPPLAKPDQRLPGASDRKPLEFLEGSAGWPSIDLVFQSRSLGMIAGYGIESWLGCGGEMRADGRLGYGAVSSQALALLRELSGKAKGFRSMDDSGANWIVVPIQNNADERTRSAVAFSWYGSGWLLDPRARRRAVRILERHMADAKTPGRGWTASDRHNFARDAHALHRIRLADLAVNLLDSLPGRHGDINFTVTDVESVLARESSAVSGSSGDQVWAAIGFAAGLQIAELKFGEFGWSPVIVRKSIAVTDAAQISTQQFRLRIAPLWSQAITTLSRETHEQNADGNPFHSWIA